MRRMHKRDIQKIKAIHSKDPTDWVVFKKLRNSVNNDIKLTKESCYKNAFCESEKNLKKTWSTINELTSRKTNEQHINEIKLNESTLSVLRRFPKSLITILPVLVQNSQMKYR